MKKLVIILVALLGLVFLFAFIAPFVVDLNKFKPAIKKLVEKNINGTFDVKDIQLSILSGFGAEVTGLSLKNSEKFKNITFISSDTVKFRASIFSIFTGVSTIDLLIDSPEINFVKNEKGELNLIDFLGQLVNVDTTEAGAPEEKVDNSELPATKSVKNIDIPANNNVETKNKENDRGVDLEARVLEFIKKVVVNVKLRDAKVKYEDLLTKSVKKVEKVNLDLIKVQLGQEFNFIFNSMIEASDFGVKGAISADGKIQADFIEGVPDILIEGNVNLGNLEIDLPALAKKTNKDEGSVEFHISFKNFKFKVKEVFKVTLTNLLGRKFNETITTEARINSNLSRAYVPQFTDIGVGFSSKGSEVNLRAKISNLDNVTFEVKSNYFNLDDFLEPQPLLKDMLLAKKLSLQ